MAAGLACSAAVDLDLDTAFVDLPPDELNMLSNIEHSLTPAFLLGVLTGKSINKSPQSQEPRLGKLAILRPCMAQCLLDLLLEFLDVDKLPVTGVDVEIGALIGALVEGHLAKTVVDKIHPLQDRLTRIVQVGGKRRQILVTLVLQQFKESLLIGGQPIRLQSNQFGEEVWRAGKARVHVARVHRPLPFEVGKACFYFLLAGTNPTVDLFDLRIECAFYRSCHLVEVVEPDCI